MNTKHTVPFPSTLHPNERAIVDRELMALVPDDSRFMTDACRHNARRWTQANPVRELPPGRPYGAEVAQ